MKKILELLGRATLQNQEVLNQNRGLVKPQTKKKNNETNGQQKNTNKKTAKNNKKWKYKRKVLKKEKNVSNTKPMKNEC
jgi:hypothetical protein